MATYSDGMCIARMLYCGLDFTCYIQLHTVMDIHGLAQRCTMLSPLSSATLPSRAESSFLLEPDHARIVRSLYTLHCPVYQLRGN